MFCYKCKYDLHDLGDARHCPECGWPFHPDRPETYRATPNSLPARPQSRRRPGQRDALWVVPAIIGFVIGKLASLGVGEAFGFLREEDVNALVLGFSEPSPAYTLTVSGILAAVACVVLIIRLRVREGQ